MSTRQKKFILNTLCLGLGCGGCKKPKLYSVFHPKPKHNKTPTIFQKYNNHISYSYSPSTSSKTNLSLNGYDTATTFSPAPDTPPAGHFSWEYTKTSRGGVRGFGSVRGESVAVEKESDDPYLDFRHSMMQMILENEIYSEEGLKELLNCFLQLNSPYHHGIIVGAFTDIWNGVFSSAPSRFASHEPHHYGYHSR